MNVQLELFREEEVRPAVRAAGPCEHRSGFVSYAFVPVGVVCSECGELLSQRIPQPPEVLGYVSADWHWHHVDGREWISSEAVA